MGDDQEDQPTTISIEEEEEVEQDVGAGSVIRSYECIFCKRGFTTAQALGGHMNIHRKDRAKSTRPNYLSNTNNNSNNIQDDHSFYANNVPRFSHPIFASYVPQGNYISTSHHHHHHQEGNINIHSNISSTSSSSSALRGINYYENINHHQDVNGVMSTAASPSRLVHEFGWSDEGDLDKDSRSRNISNVGGDDIQEDELDLELRLGQI